jgi:hypothetical protein
MKKILFIFSFLLFPALCLGYFSLSEWKYQKDIDFSFSAPGIMKFPLDDQVFSNSASDLADIRIIDGSNTEVPFKLSVGKSESKRESFYPKMINNSSVPGKNSSVILDIENTVRIINQVRIETSSENFQRNVSVFGSSDSQSWSTLKQDAYIYDYTDWKGNFASQNTAVSFPDTTFRYLKIEISDPENKPVQIRKVEAVHVVEKDAKEIQKHPQFSTSQNSAEKQTEIVIDSGSRGIPVDKVALAAKDKNFNREVVIFSGNNKSDWKFSGNGYIFRYNTDKFKGENLIVSFPETNGRYLKVVIRNKDNQPLSITGISTSYIYREAVFQAEAGKKYKLFYGNPKAKWPQYDLEKYFQYLDIEKAQTARLSAEQNNPAFVPEKELEKPLSERIPYLFSSALIIFSLILLLLAYNFLKKK